jgi:hypothetical protein
MKQIWKWALTPNCAISMPIGAEVLCVQTQNNLPCLWALVSPDPGELGYEHRHFRTYGTGHYMPDNPGKYIGTFQLNNGVLVFHVFEGVK